MPQRHELLDCVATTIMRLPTLHVLRVGIDGVDGAGKATCGDELARLVEAGGRQVIRASVDAFHHPRAIRYRLGQRSPQGYFHDSYNYAQPKAVLLNPLSPGGSGRYRTAMFDYRTDAPICTPQAQAAPGAILIFDGIFLHRPELRTYWDFSIFLEVGFAVSIPRGAQRGAGSPDPWAVENHRYVAGQQLYLRTCEPQRHATLVIDNEDLAARISSRNTLRE